MADGAAAVVAVTSFASVIVFGYLARRLWLRKVSEEARFASLQFSVFWAGLAAASLLSGIESLVAIFGTPALSFVVTFEYLDILLLSLVLWALVGFLFYLFTGKGAAFPLAVLYGVIYVLVLYYITASMPNAVTVKQGMVGVTFASTVSGTAVALLLLVLVVPEIAGILAYLSLYFRTHDPTVRYRIALVGLALLGYLGLGFLNLGALLGGSLAAQTFAQLVGVVAAVIVLLAYYPTEAIRRRYGIRGIDEDPVPPVAAPATA